MTLGVEMRSAWGLEGFKEDVRMMAGELGAELLTTFW